MPNVAAHIASAARAQGGPVPISLLELQLLNGNLYYVADAPITTWSLLSAVFSGGGTTRGPYYPRLAPSVPVTLPTADVPEGPTNMVAVPFNNWLLAPPEWAFTGTLVTQSATAIIQNTSGDTVSRDNSVIFSKADIWGALFAYRLWRADCEFAYITQLGQVTDAAIDDEQMTLSLESWLNFSKISAPDCEINNNCQNVFGSKQCGSTSSTNCLNSYGNCSQINRFKGLITQWNTGVFAAANNSGVAQPPPPVNFNSRRTG